MLNVPASMRAKCHHTTTVTSPGRPAMKVKSTVRIAFASGKPEREQHRTQIRVKITPITTARFRLKSCPFPRSISPGLARPTAQPGPASHSLTDPDRQSLHTECTCHACAAAGRARCWHWLACDVQVHNTLTQTVVRIITRMREARFDGPTLKLFLPSFPPQARAQNNPRNGGWQG